ncbi:MAG: crossover junction endodeoxyribonuclease RuvC [Phycisphaeraceae bacterium]
MQRILGIDPGLRVTGYGLVEIADPASGTLELTLIEAGLIKLDAKQPIEDRLTQLHDDLDALIKELRPDRLAVEKLFAHYKHPHTAILMAHARGVILLAARQHNLPIEHLPSTEVKKAVTGYGHASKEQIQRAVQAQCRLEQLPSPPDVADAIAIALCHARRITVAQL